MLILVGRQVGSDWARVSMRPELPGVQMVGTLLVLVVFMLVGVGRGS